MNEDKDYADVVVGRMNEDKDYAKSTDNRTILDGACNALRTISAVYNAQLDGTPLQVRHPRSGRYVSVRVTTIKDKVATCEAHGGDDNEKENSGPPSGTPPALGGGAQAFQAWFADRKARWRQRRRAFSVGLGRVDIAGHEAAPAAAYEDALGSSPLKVARRALVKNIRQAKNTQS
eukprot:g6560.t1